MLKPITDSKSKQVYYKSPFTPPFKIKDEFKELDYFDAYKAVYVDKKEIIEWLPTPWYKKIFNWLRGY